MKIAIISDIHGNSWALETILADIHLKGIPKIYDLGDSLFGPLDPKRTFKLIKEWNIQSIRGNQDEYTLENTDRDPVRKTHTYVRSQLNNEAIEWLRALPKERVLDDNIYMCHGMPHNDSEYMIEKLHKEYVGVKDPDFLDEQLFTIKQKIVLCGHSHTPRVIETNKKTIINPGSVGLPAYDDELPLPHKMENYSPKAHYCILDLTNDIKVEHIAISYDHEKAAKMAEQNRRPDWAQWLRTGWA